MTTYDWAPFSHRYGISDPAYAELWDSTIWRARHHPDATAEPEPLFRCACPGSRSTCHRCAQRATQEDRLCDACREHCWGVSTGDIRYRFIDVYGAAT